MKGSSGGLGWPRAITSSKQKCIFSSGLLTEFLLMIYISILLVSISYIYRPCLRNIINGSIFWDGDIRYVFFSCESVVFPSCFVGSDHMSTKQGPIQSSHKTKSRSQYITSHCPSITGFNVHTSSLKWFLSPGGTGEFSQ